MNGIKFKRPEGSKRNEFCVKKLPKAESFLSGADDKFRASHLRDADDLSKSFNVKLSPFFRGRDRDIMLSTGSIHVISTFVFVVESMMNGCKTSVGERKETC